MLSIIGIAPHPPIIIPDIGRGELSKVSKTIDGMQQLSQKIKDKSPELLIFITPHGNVLREGPALLTEKYLTGNFGRFGFPDLKMEFETDQKLIDILREETASEPIQPVFLDNEKHAIKNDNALDHGVMVPLYYLKKAGVNLPGLHITFSFDANRDLYSFGTALRKSIDKRGLNTAILASGDLSHRLIPGAPAGYTPRGVKYDQLLIELLRGGKVEEVLNIDPHLVEDAGECGLRSFIIALGTIDGQEFSTDIISYEGPFGVGYLVASIEPLNNKGDTLANDDSEKVKSLPEPNPAYFARQVLESYYRYGHIQEPPGELSSHYLDKAGVFVSLKKQGRLRGCIGTFEPVRKNLAAEITANAVSAATRDPRFSPVRADELPELDVSVDLLSPLEKVSSESELNPKIYGVFIRSGHRTGLLLPDLEGVDTVEEQLGIVRQKAGIRPAETAELFRFKVSRYRE